MGLVDRNREKFVKNDEKISAEPIGKTIFCG